MSRRFMKLFMINKIIKNDKFNEKINIMPALLKKYIEEINKLEYNHQLKYISKKLCPLNGTIPRSLWFFAILKNILKSHRYSDFKIMSIGNVLSKIVYTRSDYNKNYDYYIHNNRRGIKMKYTKLSNKIFKLTIDVKHNLCFQSIIDFSNNNC